jgi:hypothetical protein
VTIEPEIIAQTTGNNDDPVQVFTNNCIVSPKYPQTVPFNFEVPMYTIQGATFDYYNQNTDSISTNLNNLKTFIFDFSANTFSLSGTTEFEHDIYRLDYGSYIDAIKFANQTSTTGSTLTATTNSFTDAISALTNVYLQVFEDASGITSNPHTFALPQKVKPTGSYTVDLFTDKSQYFIDSKFVFEKSVDLTLGDVMIFSGGSAVTLYETASGSTMNLYSDGDPHQITGGTFSGTVINGAFFTYFVAPNKPNIDVVNGAPAVNGGLTTFSPIFAFNNVEDGDYYKLQINYDETDVNFTGVTTIFNIPKQIGNPEYIRTFSKPLTPNVPFLYRIGNTKEIINLFNIKQNVTTWGNYSSGVTANDGNFTLAGTAYILSEDPLNIFPGVKITIEVVAAFSSVDLGADSSQDPNIASEVTSPLGGGVGSTQTVYTGSDGTYSFGKILGGVYKLTAEPPSTSGFNTKVFYITLTEDTPNFNIIFGITWGSTSVLFSDPYSFL